MSDAANAVVSEHVECDRAVLLSDVRSCLSSAAPLLYLADISNAFSSSKMAASPSIFLI